MSGKTNCSFPKLVHIWNHHLSRPVVWCCLWYNNSSVSIQSDAWVRISTLRSLLSHALQENRATERLHIITLWCLLRIMFVCACLCCGMCACLWQPPSISHHICFVTPHLSPLRAIIWRDKSHYGLARLSVPPPQPRRRSQVGVISFN